MAVAKKIVTPKSGKIHVRLYTPHKAQWRMHKSKARFRVAPCGRRFGKTTMCINEGANHVLNDANAAVVWIAPVYRQCKVVYRVVKRALREVIAYSSDTDLRIVFLNGNTWEFYSATNPDAMRGNHWTLAIFDETADIDEIVWTEIIRPALSDTQGRAIFIGTPKGQNWFYHLYTKGLDKILVASGQWESFKFPTVANTSIPHLKEEVEAARQDMPSDAFSQEYEAEFLSDASAIFHKLDQCIVGVSKEHPERYEEDFVEPKKGITYIAGWDVAKHQDFSVISMLNTKTLHLDFWYRMNIIDYTEQVERIKGITDYYNGAAILMDATGVGDAVYEMARNAGISVEPFVYTNISKKNIIEGLQVFIEHGGENRGFTMPNIPIVVKELMTMRHKYTPSQRFVTYEAPRGYTDDCVNSLALMKEGFGDGIEIGIAVASSTPTKLSDLQQANEESRMYAERDYDNPELMERQRRVSQLLGDVELVAQFGEY